MTHTLPIPDHNHLFETPAAPSAAPRSFNYLNSTMTVHADSHDTHGGFALVEASAVSGSEPPLHVHTREDEFFYVLEGELHVRRGEESLILRAGQGAFLPRNIPHTFKIMSKHARALVYITPGGFEEYFRAFAAPLSENDSDQALPSFERITTIAARHGVSFLI